MNNRHFFRVFWAKEQWVSDNGAGVHRHKFKCWILSISPSSTIM